MEPYLLVVASNALNTDNDGISFGVLYKWNLCIALSY